MLNGQVVNDAKTGPVQQYLQVYIQPFVPVLATRTDCKLGVPICLFGSVRGRHLSAVIIVAVCWLLKNVPATDRDCRPLGGSSTRCPIAGDV